MKLRPACNIKTVAMPRFRRAHASSTRLTEVVNRVLTRAFGPGGPFGVFIVDGRCQLVGIKTGHFQMLQSRHPSSLIGTYDQSIRVADLIDDLSDNYSDDTA